MKKYSKEVKNFIAQHVKGVSNKELVELVNAEFGPIFTESKMSSYKKRHDLRSGTPRGTPPGSPTKLYPKEIQEFIKDNHVGTGPKGMAELLNKIFGTSYTNEQMKSYYSYRKINGGLNGRFEKGHIPVNYRPIGSERIDSKKGYTLIKTGEPNTWEFKHKMIWEAKYGKVPEEYVLTFLDGDKSNIKLENLALITMAESLEINRSGLRSSNSEFTKTGILIAKVNISQRKRKKSLEQKQQAERTEK